MEWGGAHKVPLLSEKVLAMLQTERKSRFTSGIWALRVYLCSSRQSKSYVHKGRAECTQWLWDRRGQGKGGSLVKLEWKVKQGTGGIRIRNRDCFDPNILYSRMICAHEYYMQYFKNIPHLVGCLVQVQILKLPLWIRQTATMASNSSWSNEDNK